jgi:hypothetical protein
VHDRLTIDRPVALGTALAEAVRTVCDRSLSLAVDELSLFDARLMCGDFESVLDLLRTAAPSPALPLLVARYVRWSGDLQSAAAAWSQVMSSLEPAFTEQLEPSLRRASLTAIAPTATDLGEAVLAARLLALARQIDVAETGGFPPADTGRDVRLVSEVALNTLGIDPDAARGRLRLRPRLDEIDELAARNIRFADGSVSIHAVRERDVLTIRVEQDAGSIPITLLLEPFVRGTGPTTVDGRPADLVPQKASADPPRPASLLIQHPGPAGPGPAAAWGTVIPVQLVLDEIRTLVIREATGIRGDEKKGPVT